MDRDTLAAGFTANAAELREQLALMSAASQLLERTAGSRERGYVAALNQSICRMLRTISRMELAHRLAEEQEPRAVLAPLDLSVWAEELARRMESVLAAAGISLQWEVPAVLPAHADGELLSRIVLEMVTAAAESGNRIRLTLNRKGDQVHITAGAEGEVPNRPLVPECLAEGREDMGMAMIRQAARIHGGTLVTCLEGGLCRSLTVIIPLGLDEPVSRLESPRAPLSTGGFDPVLVAFSHLLPESEFLQTLE